MQPLFLAECSFLFTGDVSASTLYKQNNRGARTRRQPETSFVRSASQPSLTSDMRLAVDSASTGDRFCKIYII